MSLLADEIFQDLLRRIVSDELKAGERLPPERALAAQYEANRNTLREAIRRLEQAQLVTVRQGQGVTVTEFRRTVGFEILTPFLAHGSDLREKLLALVDLLGARLQVLEYAMDLAIQRMQPDDLKRMGELTEAAVKAFQGGQREKVARAYQEWLEALVDATHSLPGRWIANPFLDLNRNLMERFPSLWVIDPSFPEYVRVCHHALEERDRELFSKANTDYYGRIDTVILNSLNQMLESVSDQPEGQSETKESS